MRAEVAAKPDAARQVDFDISLTDAMARLAYNAFYGKVDPERIDPHINVQQDWTGEGGGARDGIPREQVALAEDRRAQADASEVRALPPSARKVSGHRESAQQALQVLIGVYDYERSSAKAAIGALVDARYHD